MKCTGRPMSLYVDLGWVYEDMGYPVDVRRTLRRIPPVQRTVDRTSSMSNTSRLLILFDSLFDSNKGHCILAWTHGGDCFETP